MPPSAPESGSDLARRVISALVLAPPVLVVFYLGPPLSDVLFMVGGTIAAWEWARLCNREVFAPSGAVLPATVVAAVLAVRLGYPSIAPWVIIAGAMAAAWLAARGDQESPGWAALGALYLSAATLALAWVRAEPDGRWLLFWLLALVWATDIGAYFTGRRLGGPRLAPRFSPKKTWSGLIGGMVSAALVGLVAAAAAGGEGRPGPAALAAASALLALVAQVGDLFESALKRRFGVKDSSNLIPGHGGLLDRVDGLLAAGLALAVALWLGDAWAAN